MSYILISRDIKNTKKIEKSMKELKIRFHRYPIFNLFCSWYLENIDSEDKKILEQKFDLVIQDSPQTTHFQSHEEPGDDRRRPQVLAHPFAITIGVLDAGICSFPESKAFLDQSKSSQNPSHGTFIASRLWEKDPLHLYPGAYVKSVVVLENKSADEYFLLKNIVEAIESNPEIKIWNLSLSVSKNISDTQYSFLAQTLDYLQQKHDIIVFKTAANDFSFETSKPPLAQGADSQESIVVTSINHKDKKRSLYARVGPGPLGTSRPDCAYYGGDAYHRDGELIFEPVEGWSSLGGYRQASGTSFANPKIAKWAAEFWAIYPDYDALDVKAHLLHSCYAQEHSFEKGYGKPLPILDYLQLKTSISRYHQKLEKNEKKRYRLNPNKQYQITYASRQELHFGQKDYIGSFLKINQHLFLEAHRSFRYQGEDIVFEAKKGSVTYSLLIEEL